MCTMRISCLSGHISTTRDHPNGQPPSAVLHLHCLPSVVLSEGGLGPLGSEGSPCRGAWGVVHEHSERPSSPRPAAMASGCLPLQPLCPQLNWSHPSWMAPKGTPQLCPVCSTKGPFFFFETSNQPPKQGDWVLWRMETTGYESWSHTSNDSPAAFPKDRCLFPEKMIETRNRGWASFTTWLF